LGKIAWYLLSTYSSLQELKINPRWLAAFLVVATITAIYSIAFFRRLTPEVIVNYTMDKLEQSPIKPPPDRMAQAKEDAMQQAKQPVQRVQTVAKSYFNQFLLYSFVGALCMLGVLVFGGRINFWQSFAAVIHAALPVVVVQKLLSLLLLYIKDPADIHPILNQEGLVQDNLGFFFLPADHPVLFVLGSAIGVLSFLWPLVKSEGANECWLQSEFHRRLGNIDFALGAGTDARRGLRDLVLEFHVVSEDNCSEERRINRSPTNRKVKVSAVGRSPRLFSFVTTYKNNWYQSVKEANLVVVGEAYRSE
jgi:hypothetical protein